MYMNIKSEKLAMQLERVWQKDQDIHAHLAGGRLKVDADLGHVYRVLKSGREVRIIPRLCENGYERVQFQSVRYRVHRIVAIHVYGLPPEPRMEVAHLNHQRADNRGTNLRWCTRSWNIKQSVAAGAFTQYNNPRTRTVTDEQVMEMRALKDQGHSYKTIALRYGANRCSVRTWIGMDLAEGDRRVSPFHAQGPDGTIYIGRNLRKFCRERGLVYSRMRHAVRSGGRTTDGWTASIPTQLEQPPVPAAAAA